MKATNNTDTLFMDIFIELFAIAKVYFQELFKNADPGTYTIKDIYAFIEKNIEATKQGKLTGVNPYFSDRYEKILEKLPYYSNIVSLDLSSMTYVVNGDMGTAKNIQSIVLYDEIGKIVVSCDDGEKIERQFDGESILQSILKEM